MGWLDGVKGERVVICSGLQIYPAQSGGQWRTASLCQRLARENTVYLYSFTGRKADYLNHLPSSASQPATGVTEFVNRSRLNGFLQWLSYRLRLPPVWLGVAGLFPPPALKKALTEATVVIVDFPFLYPVWRRGNGVRVLQSHNLEHRLAAGFFKPLVRRIEEAAARRCDRLLCCAKEDLEWFSIRVDDPTRCEILPNTADPSRFIQPKAVREAVRQANGISPDEKVILFAASAFAPNREGLEFLERFNDENEPALKAKGIRFLIIGTVSQPFRRGQILALGPVDRVEPYFAAADAAINPVVSGSGTNVKMYEYLAARLPIFSTAFGSRGITLPPDAVCFSFDNTTLLEQLDRWA